MFHSAFQRTYRISKIVFQALIVLAILWTSLSIYMIRARPLPSSIAADDRILSDEARFKIAAQANRVTFKNGRAVLAWIRGTNLFFTNEHVAKNACDENGTCRFQERDRLAVSFSERELRRHSCVPLADICVLYPPGEQPSIQSFTFPQVEVGSHVYYVDWNENEYKVYRGLITANDGGRLAIDGYGRHGFSGSPIFNSNGDVLGLISQADIRSFPQLLLAIPHRLIFGWLHWDKFLAVTGGPSPWTQFQQEDLTSLEWKKEFGGFAAKYASVDEACDSFEFVSFYSRWRNFVDSKLANEPNHEDFTYEEVCHRISEVTKTI